jgi:single-strand DNA-binding protein
MQKIIVTGYLGDDPQTRSLQSGSTVTNFSVATSERWTDKNTGEKKEHTEWFRFTAFGKTGDIIAQYMKKGDYIIVTDARKRTEKWQDKNGNDRYTDNYIVDGFEFGPKAGGGQRQQEQRREPAQQAGSREAPPPADFDDDIPF